MSAPQLVELLLILVVAGGGAYLGSYLHEKGKNRATREDVKRIVQATEEIKARVSGDLWLGQARWQFRRDIYRDLLETLAELRVAYQVVASAIEDRLPARSADELWQHVQAEVGEVKRQRDKLIRSAAVAGIILSEQSLTALYELELDEQGTHSGGHGLFEYYEARIAAVQKAFFALRASARADLKMELAPTQPKGGA